MLHLFVTLQMLKSSAIDRIHELHEREDGGVVVEYGIIVATIAIGLIVVGAAFVAAVNGWFGDIAAKFPLKS
jgi:Flp pilus assembly pilin Flp